MKIKTAALFVFAMVILAACGGRKEDQTKAVDPEFVFTYAENQAEVCVRCVLKALVTMEL